MKETRRTVVSNLSRFNTHKLDHNGATYLSGVVGTYYGFVWCFTEGDEQFPSLTRLEFIWHGNGYIREVPRRMTVRGMMLMSHKFAKEIAEL